MIQAERELLLMVAEGVLHNARTALSDAPIKYRFSKEGQEYLVNEDAWCVKLRTLIIAAKESEPR